MAKKKDKSEDAEDQVKDGAAEGEEGAEGATSKKSKKKLIIILVVLIVLIGGGVGAFFALKPKDEDHAAEELGEDGKAAAQTTYYTMPQFLVNLNTSGKSSSFLKTTVVLELNGLADVVVVEANLPRLNDAMNTYLRELRASDLAGSAGIQRLREELLLRANKSLSPVKVNNILFKEIVIQ